MLSHLCNFKSQERGHISFRRLCIFQPRYSSYFQDLGFGLGANVGNGPVKLLEANAVCAQLKGNYGEVEVRLSWDAYKTRIQSQGIE